MNKSVYRCKLRCGTRTIHSVLESALFSRQHWQAESVNFGSSAASVQSLSCITSLLKQLIQLTGCRQLHGSNELQDGEAELQDMLPPEASTSKHRDREGTRRFAVGVGVEAKNLVYTYICICILSLSIFLYWDLRVQKDLRQAMLHSDAQRTQAFSRAEAEAEGVLAIAFLNSHIAC
jgi:hypothetical protein